MRRKLLRELGFLCLGGTLGTGLALLLSTQFNWAHRVSILAHGPLGVALTVLTVFWLVGHVRLRVRRATLRWRPVAEGLATLVAGGLSAATGMMLLVRSMVPLDLRPFELHWTSGAVLMAVVLWHAIRALPQYRERVPVVARGGLVAGGVGAAILAAALYPAAIIEESVVAGGPGGVFGTEVETARLSAIDPSGCAAQGCHVAIVEEHGRSVHATSHRTPQFQHVLALLHEERPDQAGFCSGCHFPATASGYPRKEQDGIACLTCHAVASVTPSSPFGARLELAQPAPHVELLEQLSSPDAGERDSAIRFIRAAAPTHARAFREGVPIDANERCLACHGLYIPDGRGAHFMPGRCVDCHVAGQAALSVDPERQDPSDPEADYVAPTRHARHLFVGGNLSVPAALGDPGMVEANRRWLEGDLVFEPQLAFWTFGEDERPPRRAAWFALRIAPESDPVPGSDWTVEIATVNVGVGHPFPSAPMDLVRIALAGELTSATGEVLWRVPADRYRLGGLTVESETGLPLTHHRIWEAHETVGPEALARGETVTEPLAIPLPGDENSYPLRLSVRWTYRDLAPDFLAQVGMEPAADPVVVLAEADATVSFRSSTGSTGR